MWSLYAKRNQLSLLANWERFLLNAPRKMILVNMDCRKLNKKFQNFALKLSKVKGFRIVREVCTDNEMVFSAAQFQSHVYDNHRPSDTVVFFGMWSGISATLSLPPFFYRVPITGLQRCERDSNIKKFMDSIPQSKRIVENAKKYIKRYLSSSSDELVLWANQSRWRQMGPARDTNREYMAVMFRLEQLFMRRKLSTEADQLEGGRKCIKGILRAVSSIKGDRPTMKVFLAMDSGRYGSYKFRRKNHTVVHQLAHDLFSGLYPGDSMSYADWEDSFARIADFSTPGYVAMLQLGVAVRASELVLAGGGSFQSIAEREIRFQHQSYTRVHQIRNC